jgi:hypothetical protein
VGTKSTAKTVTLSNSGAGALSVSSISITAGYIQSNNCTSPLLHGSSCRIAVQFAPTVVGAITGTLRINDNASNTPQVVSLSGRGVK